MSGSFLWSQLKVTFPVNIFVPISLPCHEGNILRQKTNPDWRKISPNLDSRSGFRGHKSRIKGCLILAETENWLHHRRELCLKSLHKSCTLEINVPNFLLQEWPDFLDKGNKVP